MNTASMIAETNAPIRIPPKPAAPNTKPPIIGDTTAITPGRIISLKEALVEISIQRL